MPRSTANSGAPTVAWILSLSVLVAVEGVRADAIVVTRAMQATTIAEYFVESDGVRVEIEAGVDDLRAFRNLLPDAMFEGLGYESQPLAERIRVLFRQDWVVRASEVGPLPGQVVVVELRRRQVRDEITGDPLPVQPEDAEQVLFVELAWTWKERPDSITISPPRRVETGVPEANIGFVLYHDGLPVTDFRYLGAESTVDLDWEDPWYSRFRHPNLKRRYEAPLSVFLYVDFQEVRKEIIVRPRDLQQWTDLGLSGRSTIPVERQDALKQQVAEFLMNRGRVMVDGQSVSGTLDRIHFVRRTLRATGIVDPPEPLDMNSATLGVIFVYPIQELPKRATVAWDLFGPKIQSVPAVATDEAGGLPSTLTPDDPVLVWTNYLQNPKRPAMMEVDPVESARVSLPVVSFVCFLFAAAALVTAFRGGKGGFGRSGWSVAVLAAGVSLGIVALPYGRVSVPRPLVSRPVLPDDKAAAVLHALLYNVYRAFDHREEEVVYDRLSQSASGDLLTDVYLQVRRSMELARQGGARVKIDSVDVVNVDEQSGQDDDGLAYRCRWTASGSVGHWGHIHRRTNQYDALITIRPIDGVWKIAALDVREEQRLDAGAGP